MSDLNTSPPDSVPIHTLPHYVNLLPGGVPIPIGTGLSKRELFAMHAPPPPSWFERKKWTELREFSAPQWGKHFTQKLPVPCREPYPEFLARWAFVYADAMLKASEQPREQPRESAPTT